MGKIINNLKAYLVLFAGIVLPFVMVSCSDDEDFDTDFEENGVVAAAEVSIVAGIRNISVNTTLQLNAEVAPDNAANKTILWSSDDPTIATVNQDGLIEAMGVGTAQITATLEDNTTIFDALALTVNDGTFVTTWNNTIEIIIPTNSEFSYNYDVDWDNDGVFDDIGVTGNASKSDFATTGPHTVRIRGQFPAIQFGIIVVNNIIFPFNNDIVDKIVAVNQWGDTKWESMVGAFAFCDNLEFSATDIPDLSRVTDMSRMFSDADAANPDVSQWDVSNVTNMSSMFSGTAAANPDVSQWDVANVTDMRGMFSGADAANPDVSQWNVSNVTNMSFMFSRTNVADPDVSQWDVSNVTTMSSMFSSTAAANPDVSQWNVSNVTNMFVMFSSASAANPDMRDWDIPNVTSMLSMLNNSGISPENYSAALVNFASQPTQDNVALSVSGTNFCDEQSVVDAKAILEGRGWVIADAGPTDCTTP